MRKFTETLYDSYAQEFAVDKIHFEVKTGHQHLVIFENSTFGRVMALDGIIQTTEADEFIYHEMMTHTPLFAHGNAENVLIIGGGDGGILREVCRHKTVKSVTQVEIDAEVIEMCKKYLPSHSNGSYEDPRVTIEIGDAAEFVATCDKKFDVIISDSTDPIGPGASLFTQNFYNNCHNLLNKNGIMVTQNGVAFMQKDEVTTTASRLKTVFADNTFYSAAVPTYVGGIMTFVWASDNPELKQKTAADIEAAFTKADIKTRYYNPQIHAASFALPQYIVNMLAE
ncbi:MAG: polyamine aminopropyltransferase, partial [Gammaproteobacteria bacterium]